LRKTTDSDLCASGDLVIEQHDITGGSVFNISFRRLAPVT